MRMTFRPHRSLASLLLLALALVGFTVFAELPASAALQDEIPTGILGAAFGLYVLVMIAFYIYFSLALMVIANKTGTPNSWFAWVPILNLILMIQIARKPIWWILLFLIPIVNIVILVILWMAIAEARNKPSWWGILMIVPLIGVVVPGYLAWAD